MTDKPECKHGYQWNNPTTLERFCFDCGKNMAKQSPKKPSDQIRELLKHHFRYYEEDYPEPTAYEKAIMAYLDSL